MAADAKSSNFSLEIGDIKFKWYASYKPFWKSWLILPKFSTVGAQKYIAGTSGMESRFECNNLKQISQLSRIIFYKTL